MLDRFDPRSLFYGVARDGLRKRSRTGDERPDVLGRLVLFGLPVLVAVALIWTRTVFDEPEVLLAGVALLIGALLAGFSQVATWRERVFASNREGSADGARVRALNEAGAHILFSIHVAVISAAAVFALTLIGTKLDPDDLFGYWARVVLAAVGPAALTYVALSLVIVANLLWDAFNEDEKDEKRNRLADF